MNNRASCHFLFFIKRNKLLKSGKASIFVKITVNQKHTEFALNCSVNPGLWSRNKGGANGNSVEAKIVNEFITSVKFKFQSIINQIIMESAELNADILKAKFIGIMPQTKTLLEIFDNHNKKMKSLIGTDFSNATYLKYQGCYNQLKKFILYKCNQDDLEVTKVNHEFIVDLEYYFKSEIVVFIIPP